jgi:hypothetical protein
MKLKIMGKQKIIEDTVSKMKHLPEEKLEEVHDFVAFLLSKIDDKLMQEGIQKLSSESEALSFLDDEEDLYTVNDLKERYK